MKTTRRNFLKQTTLATAGTMLVPHFLKAWENPVNVKKGQKILVVIQLSGGNDGLNTIVPFNNDLYYQYRPQLAIPKQQVLKASAELGFHPALEKLNSLYDKGYLSVINNVGYPNPDRSHFRSMDIWQTASASDTYLTTGWLGRYLDSSCADCHAAHHALEIDDTLSLALKGESTKGMAMKNPKKLYDAVHRDLFRSVVEGNQPTDFNDKATHYLYKTMAETASSADYIFDKSKVRSTPSGYPDTALANQLKTVAQLITSGIDTRVYYVSFAGFDTHVRQNQVHERLLRVYAEAVHAFVTDLEINNAMDNVLVMTFSEFGRRVAQNASGGTDHGTANNLFVIGKSLKKKGFINPTPDLSRLDSGDLIHNIDFRSVYATVLSQWLETTPESILSRPFPLLDFI